MSILSYESSENKLVKINMIICKISLFCVFFKFIISNNDLCYFSYCYI